MAARRCYTIDGRRVQGEPPASEEAADAARAILEASDEEILEEARQAGIDPHDFATDQKRRLLETVRAHRRGR